MKIIISPSKSFTDKPRLTTEVTSLLFAEQSQNIIDSLQKLSSKQLITRLNISKQLAELNVRRYQAWNQTPTKPAIWLYSGDVYNGLDAFTMKEAQIHYAQKHLLIISGLYGLVRPFDGIRPYRLEMKLPYSGVWGKNLYQAWQKPIAKYLMQSNETTLLLCASREYAKAVTALLPDTITVITPRFMQKTATGLVEKGLFAKYARGALARWVIDNEIDTYEALKKYNGDTFRYSAQDSTDTEIVYIIPKNFTLKGRFTKQ